jgi:hypothetical protein
MSYVTGTIPAGATSLIQATALRAAMETQMLAAGWEFVENYTATNIDYKIYRSPMAANGGLTDFYLALGWRNALGLYFHLAEHWDTTTKKLIRYARSTSNLNTAAPAPVTFAWNDAVGVAPDTATNLLYGPYQQLTTNAFEYWLSVTAERIYISTRIGATESVIFVGMMDDLYPASASTGVVLGLGGAGGQFNWASTSSPLHFVFTREPQRTDAHSQNFAGYIPDMNQAGAQFWTPSTSGTDAYVGRAVASRKCVFSVRATVPRALMKDMFTVWSQFASGAIAGDTAEVLVDGVGRTYVCFYQGGGASNGVWIDSTV